MFKKNDAKTCFSCARKYFCKKARNLTGEDEPLCVLYIEL
uniref:Uncharacterized protein n=1 Tax=viral metagenome TaxID=1070528 RepID=A0A6M3Y1A4_9ZZZZ